MSLCEITQKHILNIAYNRNYGYDFNRINTED